MYKIIILSAFIVFASSFSKNDDYTKDNIVPIVVEYCDFNDSLKKDTLEVHKLIADKVKIIFDSLQRLDFPIASIKPISYYQNNDSLSMANNNTYCYCDRNKTGSKQKSKHAYGLAIDINPVENPIHKKGITMPKNHSMASGKGIIRYDNSKGEKVIKLFKKYGFSWGGNWRSAKDYMHFEHKK